jgi:hypothetical protein
MSQLARNTFEVGEGVKANNMRTNRQFDKFVGLFQPEFDVRGARLYRNIGVSLAVLDMLVFGLWLVLMFTNIMAKETEFLTDIQLAGVHHLVLTIGIVHLTQSLTGAIVDQGKCTLPAASVSSVLFGIIIAFYDLAGVAKSFYFTNFTFLYRLVVCGQLVASILVILWSGAAYAWQTTSNTACSANRARVPMRAADSDDA